MEFKTLPPTQKSKESVLDKSIELVENSNLESDIKLELVFLLLDKKQGVQIGDFKIVESEEEKVKITAEFSQKMACILKFLDSLSLQYETVKELSYDNGIIGFSVLTSKDKSTLSKFTQANNGNDDKTFGKILGYPITAIEAYGTDKAFNLEEKLPSDDLEKLRAEGLLPFLLFMPSKDNWDKELEWARSNQRLIREKAPKLFQELIKGEEKKEKLDVIRKELEKVTDALGHPIEQGILETTVMLNAFELLTTASCEGHIDSHTEEYHPAMAPWVEIYPQEPEKEGWQYDDELRKKVEVESDEYLAKVMSLLDEFYLNHNVSPDIRLITDPIAYGFRVQSSGLENLKDPNDTNQQEKANKYKKEMEMFTEFLENKFLRNY